MTPGEADLTTLLRSMAPELQPGEYLFCHLPPGQPVPWGLEPLCTYQEAEGLTVIALRSAAQHAGLVGVFPCRLITLTVHSSLEAVGLLAAVTRALAQRGIAVNAVSAYTHDHLFVPLDRAEEAVEVLRGLVKGAWGGG